eukprot:10497953-Lingulodinium_polyedra.AAC.1
MAQSCTACCEPVHGATADELFVQISVSRRIATKDALRVEDKRATCPARVSAATCTLQAAVLRACARVHVCTSAR